MRPLTIPLRIARRVALLAVAAALVGCAASPPDEEPSALEAVVQESDWVRASDWRALGPTPGWRHQRYGQYRPTRYRATQHAGRSAMHASSAAGNSTLRLPLAEPVDARLRLGFSWFVPSLNERADLKDAEIDDAVARVILTFEGERDRFTARDRWLSEVVHLLTGEPLPYATLMYVWDHRYPVGTVIHNPHTDRIRMLVVQSGTDGLQRWHDLDRDVAADYRRVFGEPAPRLSGLGLMTDSNNTGASVQAWFGPLRLQATGSDQTASVEQGVD